MSNAVEILETRLLYSADVLPFSDSVFDIEQDEAEEPRVFPLVTDDGSTIEYDYTVQTGQTVAMTDFNSQSQLDGWYLFIPPSHGNVLLNGSALNINDVVTEDQVLNGELSYQHNGTSSSTTDTVTFQHEHSGHTHDNYVQWNITIPENTPPVANNTIVPMLTTTVTVDTTDISNFFTDAEGHSVVISGFEQPDQGTLLLDGTDNLTYTQTTGPTTGNFQDSTVISVRELDDSYTFALPLMTSTRELVNGIDPVSGNATLSNDGNGASFSSFVDGLNYGAIDFPDAFSIEIEAFPTNTSNNGDDILFSAGDMADVGSITVYINNIGSKDYLIAHMGEGGRAGSVGELESDNNLYVELTDSFENNWHKIAVVVDSSGQSSLIVDGSVVDSMDVSGIDYQGSDFKVGNDVFIVLDRPFDGQLRNLYVRDLTGYGTLTPPETTIDVTAFIRRYGSIPPVVANDSYVLDPDTGLVNSNDPGTQTLAANDVVSSSSTVSHSWSLATQASEGTASVGSDGGFLYFQDSPTRLNDSFEYQLTTDYLDGSDVLWTDTVTGTVNLDASGVVLGDRPVAQDDALEVDEGGTVSLTTTGESTLTANDTDGDGDGLTVLSHTQPSHGTVVVNSDGTFTYTHDGSENFTDSFTYMIEDADNDDALSPGVVNISINRVNDNTPVAVADVMNVNYGGTQTVLVGGADSILANDFDEDDGDVLQAVVLTQPTSGSVVLNLDGTFTYTHDGVSTGNDSFVYQVSDQGGRTNGATVVVNVGTNQAPTGASDAISVDEGGTSTTTASGNASLLDNDTDPDGNNLAVTGNTTPSNGSVSINPDGTFTYTHDGSEVFTDSFRYTLSDQAGEPAASDVEVSITINPVNDNDPATEKDRFRVDFGGEQDTLANGSLSVLDNDSDEDTGDVLTAELVSGPAKGTVQLNSDGTFKYQHSGVESGNDSFTYNARDLDGNTTLTVVEIKIDPPDNPPEFTGDDSDREYVVHAGVAETVDLGSLYSDEGDMTFNVTLGDAAFFSVDENSGELTISASSAEVGTHEFRLRVSDDAGQTHIQRYRIVVLPTDDGTPEPEETVTTDTEDTQDGGDGNELSIEGDNGDQEKEQGNDGSAESEPESESPTLESESGDLSMLAEAYTTLWDRVSGGSDGAGTDGSSIEVLDIDLTGQSRVQGLTNLSMSGLSGANLAGLSLDSILESDDSPETSALIDIRRGGTSSFGGDTNQLEVSPAVTTATAATGFSLGYLLWLARSGFLLSTVLSALPAWRNIDPLPVLNSASTTNTDHEDEDKSLSELTERDNNA